MFVGILIFFVMPLIRSSKPWQTVEDAVFLTPHIKSGQFDQARSESEVTSELFSTVKSYSGFLTVDETYNSNLFFWYIQIFDGLPVEQNPWIIWLSGGPGSSSMDGLFDEIGPFIVSNKTRLERNNYSWCRDHSVVFIDNPVGTGFSFTNYEEGYARDMATYALHLKLAVSQLLQVFPELRKAPLFVAGESYGGKYAPALAMELHKANEKVNLQGIITGNGMVDPSMVGQLPSVIYHTGLITTEDVTLMAPLVRKYWSELSYNNSGYALDAYYDLFLSCWDLADQNLYNIASNDIIPPLGNYIKLLERPDVRAAIHIGHIKFPIDSGGYNFTVAKMLADEFLTSARPLYEELLDHYRILAYCGLSDLMLPCYLESEEYRKWRWSQYTEFINAPRNIYYYNNQRAAYYKSGGGFTEVQIRNAGHYVPLDNPGPIQDLVADWTHNRQRGLKPIRLDYVKNLLARL